MRLRIQKPASQRKRGAYISISGHFTNLRHWALVSEVEVNELSNKVVLVANVAGLLDAKAGKV